MPPTDFELKINVSDAAGALKDRQKRVIDPRPAFERIYFEMQQRVDSVFVKLRHGGRYRGVLWRYFQPQYRRKTDGVVVPAWGGVPKLYGKGKVKGRRRPSGARVRKGDSIMQDTGRLRGEALGRMRMSRTRLRMSPIPRYAAALQKHYPFAFFFLPADAKMARNVFMEHFNRANS